MKKYLFLVFWLVFICQGVQADDRKSGAWGYVNFTYKLDKDGRWKIGDYFEYDTYHFNRFNAWYNRVKVEYRILPWLSSMVGYDYMKIPHGMKHRMAVDLKGVLREGNMKATIRERYLHSWIPDQNKETNLMRSMLKVSYDIPKTSFSPYAAVEMMLWEEWKQTRHYLGCEYTVNKHLGLDLFYMYYIFKELPSEHVLGIGLNIGF